MADLKTPGVATLLIAAWDRVCEMVDERPPPVLHNTDGELQARGGRRCEAVHAPAILRGDRREVRGRRLVPPGPRALLATLGRSRPGVTRANSATASRGPGRHNTAEERTFAALLEKRLHQLGLERARVTAVATKPGQGSDLRFEHIPVAQIDILKKAIGR